jgi:hypothetical protein
LIRQITDRYIGLDPKYLSERNTEYSCVTCGNVDCEERALYNACPYHVCIDAEDFQKEYKKFINSSTAAATTQTIELMLDKKPSDYLYHETRELKQV